MTTLTMDILRDACRKASQSLLEHDPFDEVRVGRGRRQEFLDRVREDRRASIWGISVVEDPSCPPDKAFLCMKREVVQVINLGKPSR